MVILAAVSINAAYNSGIINYAVNGTQQYVEGAHDEQSRIANAEGLMDSVMARLEGIGNGESTVPDLLRKYVLGAGYDGRDLLEILDYNGDDDGKFKNDSNSIKANAATTVIYLNELWGNGLVTNLTGYIYIKYDNVAYKIEVDRVYDSVEDETTYTTKSIAKVYEPSGMEGETISFRAKDEDTARDWLVLYDDGTNIDVTPVELGEDESWSYSLGKNDPVAMEALPSGSSVEKAIYSYNNAVSTLNNYCRNTTVTNTSPAIKGVRSIGTSFGLTDTSTYYSSTFLENNPTNYEGKYNRGGTNPGLEGDMNAEQDVVRMSYFSQDVEDGLSNYANTGSWYWLASRSLYDHSDLTIFGVGSLDSSRKGQRRSFSMVCVCLWVDLWC